MNKLEEKIKKIEEKMPGMAEKLEYNSYNCYDNFHKKSVLDVDSIDTTTYNVAVARWQDRHWGSEAGRMTGIGEDGWLTVYATPKTGGEIVEHESVKEALSNRYDYRQDREDLFPFGGVFIEHLNDDEIKIGWSDNKGNLKYVRKIDVADVYLKAQEIKVEG
jgi:hypothetical protein